MKRSLSIILILVLVCTIVTSCSSTKYKELEKSLDDYFTNSKFAFTGSVLIASDGNVILRKGYGMADYENQIANTPETVFKIGSLTKQFTAMAILMLEEQGLLSVNDPIDKYISGIKNGDKITIHNLLSMTSGIGDFVQEDWFNCDRKYTVEELISRIKEKPINFEPSAKYAYSNSNYVILGYIIENVSGMGYGEFLKKNIFDPLDMKNTAYEDRENHLKNKAKGYVNVADINKKDAVLATNMDMSYAYSAGGIYSTVEDLYKWDQALYTEKLVKKATLEKMFTPNLAYYAYGWGVLIKNKNCVQHDGRAKGFTSNIYRFMDTKTTIIILMNEEDMFGWGKIMDGLFEIAEKSGIIVMSESSK